MIFCKKAIIWDLDNTLYRLTPEYADILDGVMAKVLVEEFGIDMTYDQAKSLVKESFKKYRDGGVLFYKEYGIDEIDFYHAYHNSVPVDYIEPYEGLPEKLQNLNIPQYIFTNSTRKLAEKILHKIGLYDLLKDRIYSVEDFDNLKKNETPNVYYWLCEKIGIDAKDCIFVDDSYSNLKYPKQIGMTTVRLYYNNNSSKDLPYIDAAYNGIDNFIDAFVEETKKCPAATSCAG